MAVIPIDQVYKSIGALLVEVGAKNIPTLNELNDYQRVGTIKFIRALPPKAEVSAFCAYRMVDTQLLIDALMVHPEYRGDGLGAELLDEMLSWFNKTPFVSSATAYLDETLPDVSFGIEWLTDKGFHKVKSARKGKLAMRLNNRRSQATVNRIRMHFLTG